MATRLGLGGIPREAEIIKSSHLLGCGFPIVHLVSQSGRKVWQNQCHFLKLDIRALQLHLSSFIPEILLPINLGHIKIDISSELFLVDTSPILLKVVPLRAHKIEILIRMSFLFKNNRFTL